ncbi:hypothetical protein R3P38DRAFT_2860020 [Favolaschia claudopus]|uniref:Uncharacterized protein n=1 Tax=Favolaschia claudopus TaxID=2862362 RepID=A0AAW0DM92_9AGAR
MLARRRGVLANVLANERCNCFLLRYQHSAAAADGAPLPLDVLLNSSTPAPESGHSPVLWPRVSQRKDSLTLAREIRACGDVASLLQVLGNAPAPYSRLVTHTIVHALLRAQHPSRAGAFLVEAATPRHEAAKQPRIHSVSLAKTIQALLKTVPRIQGRQDRMRTSHDPRLLVLEPHAISDSALRNALTLYIQARKLFIRRQGNVATELWNALLNQREWVTAALFFEQQVMDYQLRRTLPTLLRPESSIEPHRQNQLRRRLAVLRLEDIYPPKGQFVDLCYRLAGVLSGILKSPGSGSLFVEAAGAVPERARKEPDLFATESDSRQISPRPPKTPLTPQRARHHVRLVLQALTVLGRLVDTRQVPFANISAWVNTVGSLPRSLMDVVVYTMIDQRPATVYARKHLREIIDRYAASPPRTPHVFSHVVIETNGNTWRGLAHRSVEAPKDTLGLYKALRATYDAPDAMPGGLTGHKSLQQLRKTDIFPLLRNATYVPPANPTEAADDSFMPPPSMPTYEALFAVLLNTPNGCAPGALYDSVPALISASQSPKKLRQAKKVAERLRKAEQREEKNYHAPRSPNNPNPLHLRYPEHPLDFDKYPNLAPVAYRKQLAIEKLGSRSIALALGRVRMVAGLLAHMLHERSPPLLPWKSKSIMQLLGRRADILRPLLGQEGGPEQGNFLLEDKWQGLWEAVWEGEARARREGEVNAAESRRLVGEAEMEAGVTSERILVRVPVEDEDEWAVDRDSGVLRPKWDEDEEADMGAEELEEFNRRLGSRASDKEVEMYREGLST